MTQFPIALLPCAAGRFFFLPVGIIPEVNAEQAQTQTHAINDAQLTEKLWELSIFNKNSATKYDYLEITGITA